MNIKRLFIIVSSIFIFNHFCKGAASEDTLLHTAVREGKKSQVQELLENNKYGIELPGDLERTPLFLAVDSRDLEVIDLLLAKKADPRAYDQFGRSVFHEALFKIHNSGGREKSMAVLKKLLDYDPSLASFEGRSVGTGRFFNIPLGFALFKGDIELFSLLLEYVKKESEDEDAFGFTLIPQGNLLVIINDSGEAYSADLPKDVIPITIATVEILLEKIKKNYDKISIIDASQAPVVQIMLHIFMARIQEALTLRKAVAQNVV